jgi:hypothetical protein
MKALKLVVNENREEKLSRLSAEINDQEKAGLEAYVRVGIALIEARQEFPSNVEFGAWREKNTNIKSQDTAYKRMRLAGFLGELPSETDIKNSDDKVDMEMIKEKALLTLSSVNASGTSPSALTEISMISPIYNNTVRQPLLERVKSGEKLEKNDVKKYFTEMTGPTEEDKLEALEFKQSQDKLHKEIYANDLAEEFDIPVEDVTETMVEKYDILKTTDKAVLVKAICDLRTQVLELGAIPVA